MIPDGQTDKVDGLKREEEEGRGDMMGWELGNLTKWGEYVGEEMGGGETRAIGEKERGKS